MTDEQIEKSLICCTICDCMNCPCYDWEEPMPECGGIARLTLDYINRLKADKEQLRKDNKALCEKKIGNLKVNEWIKIMLQCGYDVGIRDKSKSEELLKIEYLPKFAFRQQVYIIDYVDESNLSLYPNERDENTKIVVRRSFVTAIYQYAPDRFLYTVQPYNLPKELLENDTYHDEYWDRNLHESEIFETEEQAEARLKELKGEN